MESTIPLLPARHFASNSRPTSPTGSLPDDGSEICLRLRIWGRVLDEPIQTYEQQREKVEKILKFFIKVATLNNLGDTPSVKSLKDALSVLKRGGKDLFKNSESEWKAKISQLDTPEKTNYE